MPYLYIILSAIAIILVSLIGKLLTWKKMGDFLEKHTHYLTTFSAGVFTIITVSLLGEVFEGNDNKILATSSIFLGIIVIRIITDLMSPLHHHHSLENECCPHSRLDARRVIWSDTFHNAGDGVLLVTSYLIDIKIGLAATIGILFHEVVQEISEFFILREGGYSVRKALWYNFLSANSIWVGIIFAIAFSKTVTLNTVLTGLATGGFLYVLTRDLIPHSIHDAKHNHTQWQHISLFILGLFLMYFMTQIVHE